MPASSEQPLSLTGRAITHLAAAKETATGCHVQTVHQGKGLHQLLITLPASHRLGEHENPGDATLVVLLGRVVLTSSAESTTGQAGDLLLVPGTHHDLRAIEDSIVLLTIARSHENQAHS